LTACEEPLGTSHEQSLDELHEQQVHERGYGHEWIECSGRIARLIRLKPTSTVSVRSCPSADSRRVRKMPTVLRKSVPIRTFAEWNDPIPGFMEMDLVAHCGDLAAGSFVHTLTLTDISTGWMGCLPLLVREASLVVEAVDGLRGSLPFRLTGLDVDNGAEFLNDTLVRYCVAQGIEFTRSRPYHKNDQAWNGRAISRRVL